MAVAGEKQLVFLRGALWILFACGVAYAVLAATGWFDTAAEQAASEARKCATATRINVLGEAEGYCRKAIEILQRETELPVGVVARVHAEVALLAVAQKRIDESVRHCEITLAAWRDVKDDGWYDWYMGERQKKMEACESVVSAARAVKQRERNTNPRRPSGSGPKQS